LVNVDIDKDLYEDIKKLIKKNKYNYSSIKFFVQKAIYNELLNNKNTFDDNFDKFYSKLKEILQHNPELKSKIDEVYASEIKKIKKGVLQ
jgi:predicted methyltransferase